jgi:uncharacterized membrane protein YczE
MDHPVPPENILLFARDDTGWLITLALIGVIIGSLATLLLKAPLFRSILVCTILTLVVGIVLQSIGIELPFEAWVRAMAKDIVGAIAGLFDSLLNR